MLIEAGEDAFLRACAQAGIAENPDYDGERACGVAYRDGDQSHELRAAREVILATDPARRQPDIPVYGKSIGLSASWIGIIMSTNAAAGFVVRLVMHRLARRYTEVGVLTASLFIAGACYVLLPMATDIVILSALVRAWLWPGLRATAHESARRWCAVSRTQAAAHLWPLP